MNLTYLVMKNKKISISQKVTHFPFMRTTQKVYPY